VIYNCASVNASTKNRIAFQYHQHSYQKYTLFGSDAKVYARTANRIAFQYHQHSHQNYRKISSSTLLQGNDVPPENINSDNESIRHAINKLVSIIDPNGDDSKLQSSSKQSSKVHIIGSGLCPTLLNLPLSTLHILSGVSGYYCTAWKCLLLFGFSSQVRRMGIAMILDSGVEGMDAL